MIKDLPLNDHIKRILDYAKEQGASDIHLNVNVPPVLRIDGKLRAMPDEPGLSPEIIQDDVFSTMRDDDRKKLDQGLQSDFAFSYGDLRIRANVFFERSNLAAAYRLIPGKVRSMEQLGLPDIIKDLIGHKQGFVVVTGPAGHGKSTTLAAMLDKINTERSDHIVTIEDPIEYIFENKKSIFSQREVGEDAPSFDKALSSVLRQDPNVVLVGEMRDLETISSALTVAETGHLVFATLHTNSASQTVDRIIDVFPPGQQAQVRAQLAGTLRAIVSQRLIPKLNGGMVAAVEVLLANGAVRALIREGKTHQIDNVLQTSAAEGMVGLDTSLANLVNAGEITIDDALQWAVNPKQLKMGIYGQ